MTDPETKAGRQRPWLAPACYADAALLTAILATLMERPFLWIFLAWFVAAVAGMLLGGAKAKRIGFSVAVPCLMLAGLEGYLEHKARSPLREEGTPYEDYLEYDHPVLGYAPKPGATVARGKFLGDDPLYDVVYHFGDDRLRVTPGPSNSAESVVFFGGSFTFGEGVEDHETLPARTAELSGRRVHNFGLHGYGPHQMLAALEQGYAEERVGTPPALVVHQALMWHVMRVGGRSDWDPDGPCFRLAPDGAAVFAGGFRENRKPLQRWFGRSRLFAKLRDLLAQKSGKEIDLYLAIVKQAAAEAERRFPGSEFHVLLWDTSVYPHHQRVEQGLRDAGLRVHKVSEILPVDGEEAKAWQLHPADNHPTPRAYRKLAEYIVEHMLPGHK